MIGRNINNYELREVLGEGGLGTVYLAVHPVLGHKAAVKVLRRASGQDDNVVARFMNEVDAASALGHPNLAGVIDVGQLEDGAVYVMTEFLEGESLARRLGRWGQASLASVLTIMQQALAGLTAAHEAGIVHRNLKPGNLFLARHPVDGQERVKLLDFGIARLRPPVAGDALPADGGKSPRAAAYLAPEQCRGVTSDGDQRVDVYAVGTIIYEMLCGQVPFRSDSYGDMLVMQILQPPTPPRQLNQEIPEVVEQVMLRALAKDPTARFPNLPELWSALVAASGLVPVVPPPAPQRVPTPPPVALPTPPPVVVPVAAPQVAASLPVPAPAVVSVPVPAPLPVAKQAVLPVARAKAARAREIPATQPPVAMPVPAPFPALALPVPAQTSSPAPNPVFAPPANQVMGAVPQVPVWRDITERVARRPRRRWMPAARVSALALAVLAGGTWVWQRQPAPVQPVASEAIVMPLPSTTLEHQAGPVPSPVPSLPAVSVAREMLASASVLDGQGQDREARTDRSQQTRPRSRGARDVQKPSQKQLAIESGQAADSSSKRARGSRVARRIRRARVVGRSAAANRAASARPASTQAPPKMEKW